MRFTPPPPPTGREEVVLLDQYGDVVIDSDGFHEDIDERRVLQLLKPVVCRIVFSNKGKRVTTECPSTLVEQAQMLYKQDDDYDAEDGKCPESLNTRAEIKELHNAMKARICEYVPSGFTLDEIRWHKVRCAFTPYSLAPTHTHLSVAPARAVCSSAEPALL